jgi:hypothetical protein
VRRFAVVLSAYVAACASTAAADRGQPAVLRCGELSSGAVRFGPAALSNPIGAERGHDPAAVAFRAFLGTIGGSSLPAHAWRTLERTPTLVVLGHFKHPRSSPLVITYVGVFSQGKRWSVGGSGMCEPRVVRARVQQFTFPDGFHPGPKTRVLPLMVSTSRGGCVGWSYVERTELEWQPRRLVVTVFVHPSPPLPPASPTRPGVRRVCPANLIVRYTVDRVTLPHPLGRRGVFDGSWFPPKRVSYLPGPVLHPTLIPSGK